MTHSASLCIWMQRCCAGGVRCRAPPARIISALLARHSRSVLLPPTTARHAAASVVNVRLQRVPSGRLGVQFKRLGQHHRDCAGSAHLVAEPPHHVAHRAPGRVPAPGRAGHADRSHRSPPRGTNRCKWTEASRARPHRSWTGSDCAPRRRAVSGLPLSKAVAVLRSASTRSRCAPSRRPGSPPTVDGPRACGAYLSARTEGCRHGVWLFLIPLTLL